VDAYDFSFFLSSDGEPGSGLGGFLVSVVTVFLPLAQLFPRSSFFT
jgi:hypothetical protein